MNPKAKGYLLAIIAATTYGMNPLFALPLYADGMNPESVLFFRYLLAIPLLAAMLKARGRSFRVSRTAVFPLAVMGLLMALSSLALFLSYRYVAAGMTSTLLFFYPLLVALIMAAAYHERISRQTMACILMALAGIGLLYKGGDGATLSLAGTLLVFVSALSYAVYIVGVNHRRLRDIATLKVTLYVLLFGLALFAGRLLTGTELTLPRTWHFWGNLLALAVMPPAVSFLCTTKAIQYIGSTPTAILGALEPVTAIFFGLTVFGERLTVREAVGLVLIIAAVTLVVAGGRLTPLLIRLRRLFPRLPLRRRP